MKIKYCNSSQSASEYSKAKKAMEENIIAPDYLYVYNSKSKGRGIKTKKSFRKGDYVLFYSGKITSTISNLENFYFQISAGKYPKYVDGSEDDGSYGRLLNDNHLNPNLKVVSVRNADGDLIPVFFALRDIGVDEPLEYDYGGPSLLYPWRNKRLSTMDTKNLSRKRSNEKEEHCSKKTKLSMAADSESSEAWPDHKPYLCWLELPNEQDKVSVSNIKGELEGTNERIEDFLHNLTATCKKLKDVSEMQDSTSIQVNSSLGAMTERIKDLSDLQQATTLQINSLSGVADERLKEVADIQKASSLQMESLSVSTNERFKEVSDIQKGTALQISSLSSSMEGRLREISVMQGISSTQIVSLSSSTNERFNEVSNIQRDMLLQMESSTKSVSEQFKEVAEIQKSSSLQLNSLSSSTKEILNEVSKNQETSGQQISSLSSAIKDQSEEISLVHKNLTQNVEGVVTSVDEKFKEALELQTKTFHKMDRLTELNSQKFLELDKMQDVSDQQLNSFCSSTKDWVKEISEVQKVSCHQINSLSSFLNDKLREVFDLHLSANKQINLMSSTMDEKFSKNFAFQDKTNQQMDKLSQLTYERLNKILDVQEASTSRINQLSLSTDEKFKNVTEMQQASVQLINSLSSSVCEQFKETAGNQKTLSSYVDSFVDSVGKKFQEVSDLHKTNGLQLCSTSEQLKEVSERQKSSTDQVTSSSLYLQQQLKEVLEVQKETMLQMTSLSNSTNEKFCAVAKNIDSLIKEASENRRFMVKIFAALSQNNQGSQYYTSLQECQNTATNRQEPFERPSEYPSMETEPSLTASPSSQSMDAGAALRSFREKTGAGSGPLLNRDSNDLPTSQTAEGDSRLIQAPGEEECMQESQPIENGDQAPSDSEESSQGAPFSDCGQSCLDNSPAEEESVQEIFMRPIHANGEGKATEDSHYNITHPAEEVILEITEDESINNKEAPSFTKKLLKSEEKQVHWAQGSESRDQSTVQNKKRPKFLRQIRPCPFCSKCVKRFSQHVMTAHPDEKEIKEIWATNNKRQRKYLFHHLRVRAIQAENEKRQGMQELMRLKQPHKFTVKKRKHYQCSNCSMVYSEGAMSNHKKFCNFKTPAREESIIKTLPFKEETKESLGFVDDGNEFLRRIVEPMHDAGIKEEILNDKELQYIGKFFYLQQLSKNEMAGIEPARRKLRYLVKIKLKYNNTYSKKREDKMNLSNILHCFNWIHLRKLLEDLIHQKKDGKIIRKKGIPIEIKYAIEYSLKALIELYELRPGDDEAATLVDSLTKFKETYSKVKDSIFGKRAIVDAERSAKNRLVTKPPSESDLHFIIEQCNKILTIDSPEAVTETSFVRIRRAAVTRLIFFNGIRPTEVAMLTVNQWELAKMNGNLPSEQRKLLQNHMDFNVLGHFRIIPTVGKWKNIPIVVPKFLFMILNVLSDPEVRLRAGVCPDNPYLFPSAKMSQNRCCGTECVDKFLMSIFDETKNFASVQARNLLAYKFGMEDFPPEVRQCVSKFFGLSEVLNEIECQCPDVSNILKIMEPALNRIERGLIGTDSSLNEEAWRENSVEEEFIWERKVYRTPQETKNPLEPFNEGNSPGMITTDCIDDEIFSEGKKTNPSAPRKKGKHTMRWTSQQTELLRKEFQDFISGQNNYPRKGRIQDFLKAYPKAFPTSDFSGGKQNFKLRVKLNNMKTFLKKRRKTT